LNIPASLSSAQVIATIRTGWVISVFSIVFLSFGRPAPWFGSSPQTLEPLD
jgi:hypothetical protein